MPANLQNTDFGIIWLVDDDVDQRAAFGLSYRSACYHMPDCPKTVVTKECRIEVDCAIVELKTSAQKWAAKFDAWSASPYGTTLFLDNDTIILRDVTPLLCGNDYVTAVPYPNQFERDRIPSLRDAPVPASWRNVNSGVVIYSRRFLDNYSLIWRSYGDRALELPGKDQCLFSLCLAQVENVWQPSFTLQVPATPYAVEFISQIRGVPLQPALAEIPLSLLMDSYVFHYTGSSPIKKAYRELFLNTFYPEAIWNRDMPDGKALSAMEAKSLNAFEGASSAIAEKNMGLLF